MKKLRGIMSGILAVFLTLGFLACLVAALCDRKGARVGRMYLQIPR